MKRKKVVTKILSVVLSLIMIVTGLPLVGIDLFDKTVAKTISEYEVGDIIEFGSYPQSKVTDEELLTELNSLELNWISYGYYIGDNCIYSQLFLSSSDYMKYADVLLNNGERYRAVIFTQYRPCCTIFESSANETYQDDNDYYTNTVYWFKYEPLQWRVLDPNEGFIMCENIIDSQAYHNTVVMNTTNLQFYQDTNHLIYANNYSTSSIKNWLNEEFYNTAFTTAEKNVVQNLLQDNSAITSDVLEIDTETTNDKIFLLTYNEVRNKYDLYHRAQGTDYAKSQGLYVENGFSDWWLKGGYSVDEDEYDGISMYAFNVGSREWAKVFDTTYGVRPALKINPNIELERINEQYPSGYDFDYDRYNFDNFSQTIDKKIYKKAFGSEIGTKLYEEFEKNGEHGHCYGMASTTAAFIEYQSAINWFYLSSEESYASSLIQVGEKDKNELFDVNTRNYIKYGHIYQLDSDVVYARTVSENNISGLYNSVSNYVNGFGTPIVIDIWHGDYDDAHAVLAIGTLEENGRKYILINDSNTPDVVQKMEINTDTLTWNYNVTGSDFTYNYSSENGGFAYNFPADEVYRIGRLLSLNSSEFLSRNNNLITTTSNISANCDLQEIYSTSGTNETNSTTKLYWAEEYADEIEITATEDNSTISVSDNNSSVSVEIDSSDSANFFVDDDSNNSVVLNCTDEENVDISFKTANCSGDEVEIVVSATANDDNVTASLTDNGISISGVSDGDVSVVKYDEIVETKAITENESEVEIETELPNAGHNFVDGVCIDCGERTIQLEEMSSQIRFNRNDDGSYAETFDVRTRAMISDKDFTELVGSTNTEAVKNIDKIGFVYTLDGENFSANSAQAVAQGEKVAGYVDAPVKYIQEADGYYMFTCLVTDIPETDKNYTLTAYAYICVNGKWYFSEEPMNADFNSLYETYYPIACEKYGWNV